MDDIVGLFGFGSIRSPVQVIRGWVTVLMGGRNCVLVIELGQK